MLFFKVSHNKFFPFFLVLVFFCFSNGNLYYQTLLGKNVCYIQSSEKKGNRIIVNFYTLSYLFFAPLCTNLIV